MARIMKPLVTLVALTSLLVVQCMAQKPQGGKYAPIVWRRVLQDLGPVAEAQRAHTFTHTRAPKIFQMLTDLFAPEPATTPTPEPTATVERPVDPAPGNSQASTAGSRLSNAVETLGKGISIIASLANDDTVDDVVDDVADTADSVCECKAVPDVVQAFFAYCDGVADVACCGALKRAGANTLVGCPCAETVACNTAAFDGVQTMRDCGYDMGICI